MTDQQVTGILDEAHEAQAPVVPEQAEPQDQTADRVPTEPDPVAAAAVDLAREAAEDVAQPGTVGRHLSVSVDQSGLTLHAFDCTAKGYRGWRWAVTLAHVPGSDRVTICDTVLLPGAESIMAPDWVPWSDRLAPGDLGAGDELPYKPDDPNLVPGYTVTDEDDADQQLFWELGLGRERVLGREGLANAADRWHRGPHGPTSDVAVQAAASCVTCAYFVPLSGVMRQAFGACANEWSPADGTVVTADFGCGAHSETDLEMPAPEPLSDHILDETIVDKIDLAAADEPTPGIETGSSVDASLVGERDGGVEAEADVEAGVEAEDVVDSGATPVAEETADVDTAHIGNVAEDDESRDDAVRDEAAPVESVEPASWAAPQPRDAGGTIGDVVPAEPTPSVEVTAEPTVDPEPVASPEDLVAVRSLGTSDEQREAVDPPSGETGEVLLQGEPDQDLVPPPALSPEVAAAEGEEHSAGEAVQGEAVTPVSEYTESPGADPVADEGLSPEAPHGTPSGAAVAVDSAEAAAHPEPAAEAVAGWPEHGQAAVTQAEPAQDEAAQADVVQGDVVQADAEHTVVAQAETAEPDAGQADVVNADAAESSAGAADVAEPGAAHAGVVQADAGQADVAEPAAAGADVAEPDVAGADAVNAEAAHADAAQTDAAQTEASAADADTKPQDRPEVPPQP